MIMFSRFRFKVPGVRDHPQRRTQAFGGEASEVKRSLEENETAGKTPLRRTKGLLCIWSPYMVVSNNII